MYCVVCGYSWGGWRIVYCYCYWLVLLVCVFLVVYWLVVLVVVRCWWMVCIRFVVGVVVGLGFGVCLCGVGGVVYLDGVWFVMFSCFCYVLDCWSWLFMFWLVGWIGFVLLLLLVRSWCYWIGMCYRLVVSVCVKWWFFEVLF